MKIVRIDVTDFKSSIADLPEKYLELGGRGLTARILSEEVDPRCDALGAENKLVIATGVLAGTTAPCSGRTSLGAKSPLTGTIKESNVGGIASQYLAGHGIRAMVVEGMPESKGCGVLVIDEDGIRMEQMESLSSLGNYDTVTALRKEFGADAAVISVGPAGEHGSAMGTVAVCDPEGRPARHAGRGGMGAVMASKGLKAIVLSRPAKMGVLPADAVSFKETVKGFAKTLHETKKALTTYGTAVLVNVVNETGGLPSRNFSAGKNENIAEFSGEKLHQLCKERGGATGHACHRGCAIRCSNVFHDAEGEYVTAGLEYETIALLGPNCGVHDLDAIARFDRLCDDLGIDTMEMGVTLGVAMEGGRLAFGDVEAMTKAIGSVASADPEGDIFRQGATAAGRALGVTRVPAVKGQSISGYDPRALKGTGVSYATSTMGGDHTVGNCLPGRGGLDSHKPEGQAKLSRRLQEISMVCDILGVCIFVGPVDETMPTFSSLVSAYHGKEVSIEALLDQAREALRLETVFNKEAGIASSENDLPAFFREEPLPETGLVFDVPQQELADLDFSATEEAEMGKVG